MNFKDFLLGWAVSEEIRASRERQAERIERYLSKGEYAPAGIFRRLFSLLIDSIVLGLVAAVFQDTKWVAAYDRIDPIFGMAGWLIFLYFGLFLLFKGQTLGKMFAGIAVISNIGGKLRWWQALIRTPVFFLTMIGPIYVVEGLGSESLLEYLPLIFPIHLLVVLLNKDRKGIHDFITGTRVVHKTWH